MTLTRTPRSAFSGKHALLLETALNPALPEMLKGRKSAQGLDVICALLNGAPSDLLCQELRKLIHTWQKSGPNLKRMLDDDKLLADRLQRGSTFLVPSSRGEGNGYLGWEPTGLGKLIGWDGVALRYFLFLVVHPQWHKLSGPCARCGRYYVKRRASQKIYCTKICGNRRTAAAATKLARAREHSSRLERATKAIVDWKRAHTKLGCKEWVARQHADITAKFLTRAVNRGELRPPEKDT